MINKELYYFVKKIETKNDFLHFMKMLMNDYNINKDLWENNKLDSYLNGIDGYVDDSLLDNDINWKILANILLAAKVYE